VSVFWQKIQEIRPVVEEQIFEGSRSEGIPVKDKDEFQERSFVDNSHVDENDIFYRVDLICVLFRQLFKSVLHMNTWCLRWEQKV